MDTWGGRAPLASLEASLDRAVLQYLAMDQALPDTLFPRTASPDGALVTNRSDWWTSGFFPGSLWYLFEYSADPTLAERARARTRAVEREKLNAGDHDIGFKIFNSFGNGWRLTRDTTFLPVLVTAAHTLASRFDPRVGAIRSWGAHPDTLSPYLVIIDNMMNLELLFWAARHTRDSSLYDIAVSHADKTLENHFRPDGSSYHVVEYDPKTGQVLRKRTEQGFSDASAWARGQAWGLYGFTMAYRETGYARYLEQAERIANFLLSHPHLPADGVPYWDFDAPGIPDTYRDASAASIMASALLELAEFVDDSLRSVYRENATGSLRTLSEAPYRTDPGDTTHFLLKHGVGSLPAESEVDVPLSYADYYYIEALLRLRAILRGSAESVRITTLEPGWARSSVNAVIFRQHGLVTHDSIQYAAFYDANGSVALARRRIDAAVWEVRTTPYRADVTDAHDAISIGVDGGGFLHVSWGMHDESLRYARGRSPGALDLTEPLPMTGRDESSVSYPQFYELPNGDLLFLYRDGSSGDGDVVLNRYFTETGEWAPVHHPLIDGEGSRNAYPNRMAVDSEGGLHLSWTWRETWDVATNHDILYAYSPDGGESWQRSDGAPFDLPITASGAEVAVAVPMGRGLINQTTMAVDEEGHPFIATYWMPERSDVPQYHLVWHDGARWHANTIGERATPFDLSGGGTRRIPMSRPLVLTGPSGQVYVVFRDEERGGGITLAVSTDPDRADWELREVYRASVGQWEPIYDPAIWFRYGKLHLLVQRVGQGEAEGLEGIPPQPVTVMEWAPGPGLASGG